VDSSGGGSRALIFHLKLRAQNRFHIQTKCYIQNPIYYLYAPIAVRDHFLSVDP
jgi:hypothetical protein